MNTRLSPLALPLVAVLGLPASAAGAELAAGLDDVVVTATRTARSVDETLAAVTVITRKDIERSQAKGVDDLLRGQPGLSVSNNGGAGKATSVFLRGTESDHVLVLVDGVKIGSATLGTAALQDLPLELIERIEIVRGPRSSLYGSEAIGGVIHIFTKRGGGAALKPSLSLGAGSNQTWQAAASLHGGLGEAGWFSLGLSGLDTAGFNACKGSFSAGCFTVEPDRDAYRNLAARLRAGWRFGDGGEAEINWLRADGENEFDGGFQNESESAQQLLSATLRLRPLANWSASLLVALSEDRSDNFHDGIFSTRFDTRRETVSLQNTLELGAAGQVVLGIDRQDDEVSGSTVYAADSRDTTGLFAEYLVRLAGHDLQASLRHDDNSQFGGHVTGGLAWGHDLADGLRLTASYGTAFKAPTFNELYFPGFGNPDLRPEASRSVEFGLTGRTEAGRWSLGVFETRVTDLVGFDASFSPVNIDSARIRGFEGETVWRLGGWDLRGNLTLLDPVNRSAGANRGNLLPRRAERALAVHADRDFGAWSVGASLRGEGRRYDNLANTRPLEGYAILDLRGEYHLDRDWRLQARLENLLDKDYQTAYLYNQPGRGLYLNLRYQPK
jgi:vitamin B12 transporter